MFASTEPSDPSLRDCKLYEGKGAACNRRTLDSYEIIRKGTSVKAGLAAVRFVESSQ